MAKWGSGRSGSIHFSDLPDRIRNDVNRYLDEESRVDEQTRVVDEASAREYINKVLPRKAGLGAYVPNEMTDADYAEIISGSHIQGLLSKNKQAQAGLQNKGVLKPFDKNAFEDAVKAEGRRKRASRRQDESKNAKRILPVTKQNVRRWKKQKGQVDIAGVDTRWKRRVGGRGKILRPKRTSKWVRYVSSRGNYYVYRDLKGRFLKNPESRKR